MNSFDYHSNVFTDPISVEVQNDDLFYSDLLAAPPEMYDDSLDTDQFLSEFSVSGTCDLVDLTDSITHATVPSEFDQYLGPTFSTNLYSDKNDKLALFNSLPLHISDKNKKVKPTKNPISLSQSVGVGVPLGSLKTSCKIEIVYDLEAMFRARYKSDYFAQNGKSRKPRYVADRMGNHYITLKVPPGIQGRIRIDWLTVPTKDGELYHMPYQFQASNELSGAPDCNPLFTDIDADATGTVKLYLVLIKSKQDALKSCQQLQPFYPMQNSLEVSVKKPLEGARKLTPKQIIQKYQLDKSQLAFTLCPISANGKSYVPDWDTTAYSTVLTEEDGASPATKIVACPHCAHKIQIAVGDGDDIDQETIANKRKNMPTKTEKPKPMKKQRSSSDDVHILD